MVKKRPHVDTKGLIAYEKLLLCYLRFISSNEFVLGSSASYTSIDVLIFVFL